MQITDIESLIHGGDASVLHTITGHSDKAVTVHGIGHLRTFTVSKSGDIVISHWRDTDDEHEPYCLTLVQVRSTSAAEGSSGQGQGHQVKKRVF